MPTDFRIKHRLMGLKLFFTYVCFVLVCFLCVLVLYLAFLNRSEVFMPFIFILRCATYNFDAHGSR